MSSLLLFLAIYILIVHSVRPAAAVFGSVPSLPDLVHNWLHWGANLHSLDTAPPAHHPHAHHHPSQSLPLPPSYVVGAATANTTVTPHTLYHLQMMHRPEIDLVTSYLTKHHVYLEYGAGGSTYNFASLVANAYSIEHNCKWADHVRTNLLELGEMYSQVNITCVEVKRGFRSWGTVSDIEHANYYQFREYVDAVQNLPHTSFDRVFIDGRARLACALKVLPYLKNDSLVFIHDFYSRIQHYSPVLRYYTEVARVLARPNDDVTQGPLYEPQGVIVLRRRDNFTKPLQVEEIDDIYESINWRYPFVEPLTSISAYIKYYLIFTNISTWKRARSPKDLVKLVKKDLKKVIIAYVILLILVHLWSKRSAREMSKKDMAKKSKIVTNSAAPYVLPKDTTGEIRFIETEGMRVAKARRKRASALGIGANL